MAVDILPRMRVSFRRSLNHHGPDKINDAILTTLPLTGGTPFRDLADALMATVFPTKTTAQSREQLRLRIYEQLQDLVKHGRVERIGEGAGKLYLRTEDVGVAQRNGS